MARDKRTFPTVLTQGPVNRMKRRGIRTITSSRLSVRDQAIAAMSLSNAGLSLSLVDQMSRQYTTCNLPTYRGFKQDRSCEYTPGTAEDIYHVVRGQNYFRVRQLPSPLTYSPPPIRCCYARPWGVSTLALSLSTASVQIVTPFTLTRGNQIPI